jgi:ATP synthase protein I
VWIAVSLQVLVTLLAGIVTWLVWEPLQAVSLVAGGGSIAVPNALLALRLSTSQPDFAPVVLLIGEFVKIVLSIVLLWLAYRSIPGMSWGALIVGVVLALKIVWLTPWVQGRLDRRRAARV